MTGFPATETNSIPLDIFGQVPRLSRLYTQVCFCFHLEDSSSPDKVAIYLQNGYARLAASFPWVAGSVKFDRKDGLYKTVPSTRTTSSEGNELNRRFKVKDLKGKLPSFEAMRDAGFPVSLLQEQDLASTSTLPASDDDPSVAPQDESDSQGDAAVFEVQANFVFGGCLLVFSAQHNCMDIAAMIEAIRLFAKACQGPHFTREDLMFSDLDRWAKSPPTSSSKEGCAHQSTGQDTTKTPRPTGQAEPASGDGYQGSKAPPASWSYLLFSRAAQDELKAQATRELPQNARSSFVSTDDVLCAFLWKYITRARSDRLASLSTDLTNVKTRFERLVNTRQYLNLPVAYPGNYVHKVTATLSSTQVVEKPLGYLASRLRASLSEPERIRYEVEESAEVLRQIVQSRSQPALPQRPKPSSMDVKISSWAKEKCYEFDFGGELRKAEAVRRPTFEAWEGLAFLMPKKEDGEIAAALCLREEDLDRLKRDEEFTRWCRWVG